MMLMPLTNVLLLLCGVKVVHSLRNGDIWRDNGNNYEVVEGIDETVPGTVGREFVFNFPTPHTPTGHAPTVMISTSSITPVYVNISISGIGFYQETTTIRQQQAKIELPTSTYLQQGSFVQDKTVIVRANAEVSVYGMTTEGYAPDAFIAIPSRRLGNEYVVVTYGPSCGYPTEFSLSAVDDQTDVQISTSVGHFITITMNAYESYQVHDAYNDLTGSTILSNKPIAVMAESEATGVPAGIGCDALLEALPSVDMYGHSFILSPFMGRAGYVYRIVASEKATVVVANIGTFDINAGEFIEQNVDNEDIISIESDTPVLVAQYMKGYDDDNIGDASMVIVPATDMYSGNITFLVYNVTRYSGYSYYINVIANCIFIPDMTYDDTIHVADWDTLYQDAMCVVRAEVTPGTHSVGHPDPDATLSVTVYGFQRHDAFSYSAGFNMIPRDSSPITHPAETTSMSLPTDSFTTTSEAPATTFPTTEDPSTTLPLTEEPTTTFPPTDDPQGTLNCNDSTMAVFLSKNATRGVEAEDLHLINKTCIGEAYNDTHNLIWTSYEHCGTVMEVRDDYIVFSNVVLNEVVPVSPGSEFTRERHVEIPVECYMRRNGTSYISFHPETSKIIFSEEGFGQFSFQMQLYPDKQYRSPYPADAYPIDVHLQDMLYFEAKVSSDQDGLMLFLDSCAATQSVNPYGKTRYVIIDQGCAKDNTLEFYASDDQMIKRFGWQALGSIEADIPIYVHCFLVICNSTDPMSKCALGCQSGIHKREIRASSKPYLMTEGPIRFIGSDHESNIDVSSDESNVLSILVASFGMISCCLGVALAVLLRKKNNNGYEPVQTSDADEE